MKEIKDIPTIPFSKRELARNYEMTRFIHGRVQTRSRVEARRIYSLLQVYCEAKNLGEAFAHKVRTKKKK